MNESINIKDNIDGWFNKIPDSNDASFDYCFNYFQSFREANEVAALESAEHMEMACLQLGFYLASWGMYRGSAGLAERSSKYLTRIIKAVANADRKLWGVDADDYSPENIGLILRFWDKLCRECKCDGATKTDETITMTDTLATKIMLGVFGCVPAFDSVFKIGCGRLGIQKTLNATSLQQIENFYRRYQTVIDECQHFTQVFGEKPNQRRPYTKAKLIDMAIFRAGELRQASIRYGTSTSTAV